MTLSRTERQRGSATAELVIGTSLAMLMVLLGIGFALWQHGGSVARAAAIEGLAAARAHGGSAGSGQAAARQVLGELASGLLTEASVSVSRSATTVSVEVSATAVEVVPGLRLPVRARVAGPVEIYKAPVR